MSQRIWVLVLIFLALPFALQASNLSATQGNWVYLQSGANLRVSIETYQARRGWTPVVVSLAGTEVSAVMDCQGRVFHKWSAGLGGRGVPLFIIDVERGTIQLEGKNHAIRVYEQNGVRTRFLFSEGTVELPLQLDRQGKAGVLRFGRLEIPAGVSAITIGRTVGNRSELKAGLAPSLMTGKGYKAVAQLAPSRIKARGK